MGALGLLQLQDTGRDERSELHAAKPHTGIGHVQRRDTGAHTPRLPACWSPEPELELSCRAGGDGPWIDQGIRLSYWVMLGFLLVVRGGSGSAFLSTLVRSPRPHPRSTSTSTSGATLVLVH